mmetsp:Transcript_14027/g.37657  ORF Transcript_14027/g.37657 Transcript_14027/m.37657 type:complete len:381 (-) Transcript_14027:930-2072(-)|eukprot:CAMPEP_0185839470 /NCGR_PEP_ID=MMETSP1353-20130828/14627_1 /TAXON_ID=1077150 /ORGANISM="Erythrolobus australicus, Strain CCMP3124" /LENGTH=380 /DNA_ID=CAMNT_0028538641 /DNA_START=59 /DNA_END=1201 /DNA_ORIENTATION=-
MWMYASSAQRIAPALLGVAAGGFLADTGAAHCEVKVDDVGTAAVTTGISSRGFFAPGHGILGGATIGLAVAANALLLGRVTGNSGMIRGAFTRMPAATNAYQIAYVGGLLSAGLFFRQVAPELFPTDSYKQAGLPRIAAGSFLIGLGATIGNGCTAGHSVCGMARLSARSAVFTAIYMATASAVSHLTSTAQAFGASKEKPKLAAPTASVINRVVGFNAVMSGLYFAASRLARKPPIIDPVISYATGAHFGAGLAVSGMTLPEKVASFLDFDKPWYDGSLAMVMGTALAISFVAFRTVLTRRVCSVYGSKLSITTNNAIDKKLVSGAVLFGSGWGATGMCPGPMAVSATGEESGYALIGFAAVLAGMVTAGRISPLIFRG